MGRLAVHAVEEESREDKQRSQPLSRQQRVAEEQHRAQHGEELAGGGDDGARQRPELGHRQEDEELAEGVGHGKTRQLPDDVRVASHEGQEVPHLSGQQHGHRDENAGPQVHVQHHVARLGLVLGTHALLYGAGEAVHGQGQHQQQLAHPAGRSLRRSTRVVLIDEQGHAHHDQQHEEILLHGISVRN